MQNIETTLTLKDICQIFHIKPVTAYRWVREAREGRTNFPQPINNYKRKLLWSRDAIIAFQNAGSPQPPKIESATQRNKRHHAACQMLKKQGVKIKMDGVAAD